MGIEDVRTLIEETYERTGGRWPSRLVCGRRLFQTLYEKGMIEYSLNNGMRAEFCGIPIISVHSPDLIGDDMAIAITDDCYDYWTTRDIEWHSEALMKDVIDDIDISEEEFLRILNSSD